MNCNTNELMDFFNDFLMIHSITDYHINSIKLGVRIALLKLQGITKKHSNKGWIYIIDICELRKSIIYDCGLN